MRKYLIKEIFGPTIEGEGSNAGKVVLFLRFSGCNKWQGTPETKADSVCTFCDTDFHGGERMTALDISESLRKLDNGLCRDLVISGGEPLLQLDYELLRELTIYWTIHIETNGSRILSDEMAGLITTVTMSPKQVRGDCMLRGCDDLKILYPPIHAGIAPDRFKDFPCKNKFLQPVMGDDYEINLEKTLQYLYKNPQWRLSLQIHKIIGVA